MGFSSEQWLLIRSLDQSMRSLKRKHSASNTHIITLWSIPTSSTKWMSDSKYCCHMIPDHRHGNHQSVGASFHLRRFKVDSLLGAYPRQDVAAQMSLRNWCLSSATLLAAAIVPNISVMSFSHICLGFPLLFPATIPCIIVFSKPLWRVLRWPKYFSFWHLTILYSQFVGRWSSFNIEQLVRWAIQGIRNILR